MATTTTKPDGPLYAARWAGENRLAVELHAPAIANMRPEVIAELQRAVVAELADNPEVAKLRKMLAGRRDVQSRAMRAEAASEQATAARAEALEAGDVDGIVQADAALASATTTATAARQVLESLDQPIRTQQAEVKNVARRVIVEIWRDLLDQAVATRERQRAAVEKAAGKLIPELSRAAAIATLFEFASEGNDIIGPSSLDQAEAAAIKELTAASGNTASGSASAGADVPAAARA